MFVDSYIKSTVRRRRSAVTAPRKWKNAAAAASAVVAAACLQIDSDKPVTVLIIPRYISFTTEQLQNLSGVSNHIIINNVFAKSHKKLGTSDWLTVNLNLD